LPDSPLPNHYTLVKTRMTVLQKNAFRRRHFARMLESVIASYALAAMVSLPGTAMGQSPSCGCESSGPSCGAEFVGPSCGCENSNLFPTAVPPKQPVYYRARSLSFAEKFLKQLDRVGDQIEWEASRKPSRSTCTNGCPNTVLSSCPSCGCESSSHAPFAGMSSCGVGPSIPFGSPSSSSGEGLGVTENQPFVNKPSRAGQGGHANSPLGDAPMFPHKPKDIQALGKISDHGTISPKLEKPVAAPAPQPPQSSTTEQTTPPSPPPFTEEDGNIDNPNPAPNDFPKALAPSRNKTTIDHLPSLRPTPTELPTSETDEPSPMLPSGLPQSQDEIPDVLVDPFKDDASWKSNRNRLNGVRLTAGEMPNPLRSIATTPKEAEPKLLPTPHDNEPTTYDDLPPVLVKPKVINRYRSMESEWGPTVNRVAVPKKKL